MNRTMFARLPMNDRPASLGDRVLAALQQATELRAERARLGCARQEVVATLRTLREQTVALGLRCDECRRDRETDAERRGSRLKALRARYFGPSLR